jgi:hypothetical protein
MVPTYQARDAEQCGKKPCWSASAAGWKFVSDPTALGGIVEMTLKEGPVPGKAKIALRAKRLSAMEALPLQVAPSVLAQVRASTGKCWGAVFSSPTRNDAREFVATSD